MAAIMPPGEAKQDKSSGAPCPALVKMVGDKCQLELSVGAAADKMSSAVERALLRGRRARKSMLRHLSAPLGPEDVHAMSLRRSLMISDRGYDESGATRALSIPGFQHTRSLSEESGALVQRRLELRDQRNVRSLLEANSNLPAEIDTAAGRRKLGSYTGSCVARPVSTLTVLEV